MKEYVDEKLMTKALVDGGAIVNFMRYTIYRKLGKGHEDLIDTEMMVWDFWRKCISEQGALNVKLMVGSKNLPTTFFIIDGKGS